MYVRRYLGYYVAIAAAAPAAVDAGRFVGVAVLVVPAAATAAISVCEFESSVSFTPSMGVGLVLSVELARFRIAFERA